MKNEAGFDPHHWAYFVAYMPQPPDSDDHWARWSGGLSDLVRDLLAGWVSRDQQLYGLTKPPGLAVMVPRQSTHYLDAVAAGLQKEKITLTRITPTPDDPVMVVVGPGWSGNGDIFQIRRTGKTTWIIERQPHSTSSPQMNISPVN